MRKGQAALEFLTTYGWAFLLILVIIGALVYFGVLNPSRALPNKCETEAGFFCKDYRILEGSFDINLQNKKGEALKLMSLTDISSDAFITAPALGDCDITVGGSPSSTVPADEDFVITCTSAGMFTGLAGEKVKVDYGFNYTLAKGTYSQTTTGSIYSQIQ